MVELIVRDHDAAKMDEHLALIRRLAAEVREREPRASVEVTRRSSTGTWAR